MQPVHAPRPPAQHTLGCVAESPLLLPSRAGTPGTRLGNASAAAFERPPVAGTSDFREFVLEMQKTIRDLRKQVGRSPSSPPRPARPLSTLGPGVRFSRDGEGKMLPAHPWSSVPEPPGRSLSSLCPSLWLGSSWATLSCPWTSWDRGPLAVGCPLARWVRGAGSP